MALVRSRSCWVDTEAYECEVLVLMVDVLRLSTLFDPLPWVEWGCMGGWLVGPGEDVFPVVSP